jgi:D-glycero-D-manno-heptose 1,7-bisphosphate phosphatase
MTIKTIFLDRDGVINKEVNYLHRIEDFKFIDGVFETCKYFISLNYKIIVVTNQSGISRGFYTEGEFQILTNWMLSKFMENDINILDVFHCPHLSDLNCSCRKPKPGMFFDAQNKHNINMKESWMIGDSERDISAANSAGIKHTILVRSGHKINEGNSSAMFFLDSINQANQFILK